METFSVRFVLTRRFEGSVEVTAESQAAARLALSEEMKIDEAYLTSNDVGQVEVVSVVRLEQQEVA